MDIRDVHPLKYLSLELLDMRKYFSYPDQAMLCQNLRLTQDLRPRPGPINDRPFSIDHVIALDGIEFHGPL